MSAETADAKEPSQQGLGEATRAYQAAVDDFDRELARLFGINETDLRCLEILLLELPEALPSQLAERLGLTTGSTTALLDRLEKAGHLARSPHPTDRRKSIVRATPAFQKAAYDLMAPLVDEGHQMVADNYTPQQIATITDYLRRAIALQQRHTRQLRSMPRMRGAEQDTTASRG
ncbi:MarR family winged helix-turn-helix transcriptional regulator [Streptomyces sp. GbtcB6]|uniref:MarR family winged helix-turn-helix transcriptional regulator n=1 Tax=Streptomyces sp. GbtcB6 TaxID=2824751 RepID=UPI001C30F89A|nr:MarR family transcriptional regulator [Streptomyces sp. GbtcB6]